MTRGRPALKTALAGPGIVFQDLRTGWQLVELGNRVVLWAFVRVYRWYDNRTSCKMETENNPEIRHGNPDQFFCAPTNIHVLRPQSGLVHLPDQHASPSLHCDRRNLPTIGAERNKLGGMVAEFYSSRAWDHRATRLGTTASRNSRHRSFYLALAISKPGRTAEMSRVSVLRNLGR